ncbi:hypothetical protein [uncultured Roseibium sp.]|uniref:hypothetical protein n=1 Tax=uncultured Roseibium sp. TaxID=1936171 RepID=UPI00260FB7EA|nr:hypothetical protein [uncultured Roseibium sp.]
MFDSPNALADLTYPAKSAIALSALLFSAAESPVGRYAANCIDPSLAHDPRALIALLSGATPDLDTMARKRVTNPTLATAGQQSSNWKQVTMAIPYPKSDNAFHPT